MKRDFLISLGTLIFFTFNLFAEVESDRLTSNLKTNDNKKLDFWLATGILIDKNLEANKWGLLRTNHAELSYILNPHLKLRCHVEERYRPSNLSIFTQPALLYYPFGIDVQKGINFYTGIGPKFHTQWSSLGITNSLNYQGILGAEFGPIWGLKIKLEYTIDRYMKWEKKNLFPSRMVIESIDGSILKPFISNLILAVLLFLIY